jgi:exosome complex RNA-binding protein Rrp42 (RNase PH superfamily)
MATEKKPGGIPPGLIIFMQPGHGVVFRVDNDNEGVSKFLRGVNEKMRRENRIDLPKMCPF